MNKVTISGVRYLSKPEVFTLAGAAQRTSVLDPGFYTVVCTAACFILQGDSTVTADGVSNYVPADTPVRFEVLGDRSNYLSIFGASGTAYVIREHG